MGGQTPHALVGTCEGLHGTAPRILWSGSQMEGKQNIQHLAYLDQVVEDGGERLAHKTL